MRYQKIYFMGSITISEIISIKSNMIHWYIVFNVNEKYTPDRDWIYILYSSTFSNFTDILKHLSASSLFPNFCNESPLFLYALVL